MLLSDIPFMKQTRVIGVRDNGPVTTRLMEMGLIEGAEVTIIGRAPLGDPLHVRITDYDLAIRADEARLVEVSAA